MKKLTKTAAKKKAYHAFQMYLRTLWTIKGTVPCYTCNKPLTFKQCQVGHWVTGHSNAVYINEDYVKPQCVGCNIMQGGRQGEFRDRLRKEYGSKIIDDLLLAAKESIKISTEDYQELERYYKESLDKLKEVT